MVWIKRINNPLGDQGDSTHVGTDHWDLNDKYHDNIDISASITNPTKIATPTSFRDQILKILNSDQSAAYTLKAGTISSNVNLSLPNLSGDATLMAAGGANDFGDSSQTFRSTYFIMRNPANSNSYIHTTSAIAGNRVVTWPLLTADDEVAFKAHTQTLVNKTYNIDQNTFKHSTTNSQGDIFKYDTTAGKYIRLARGTANQVLHVNGAGTDLEWSAESGSLNADKVKVYEGGTLIGSVARKLNFNSSHFNCTLDSGNDEVDIDLANPGGGGGGSTSGIVTPEENNVITGVWYGTSIDGGTGIWSNNIQNTSTITPIPISDTSGRIGLRYNFLADDDRGGFRDKTLTFTRQNDPELWVRYKYDPLSASHTSSTNYRVVIGFTSDVAADYGSDGALDNKSAFMWFKETADTSIQIGRNAGDATTTKDTTVSVAQTNSSIHTIKVFADNASTRFGISLDGGTVTYHTTDIPSANIRLGCIVQFENENSDDRSFELYGSYFKCKII